MKMGLHKQYLKVGQSAKNKLFGISPGGEYDARLGAKPLSMLISEQGKINHGRLYVIMFGVFTLALGIILSSIPWIDFIILKNLRLSNGSLSFQYWQKPGVNRLTKVYIFNVTNPHEFYEKGHKPKLQEVGPFVYREDMEKVNIKFHDNDTVTFQHNKILKFVPELSVDKFQKLVVPNIPLLTLTTKSNYLGMLLQKTISFALSLYKVQPFVHVTAEELVFGYDDPLISLAHKFYPRHKRPMSKMGLLIARNGTLNEVATIHTGYSGMEKFGYMDKLNGLDRLPYWEDKPCTDIRASEGSFFPPRSITKSDMLYIYDKDLCRIIPLQYRSPTVKDGIEADIYTPPDNIFETVKNEPENKCYCPGNEFCPPKGLQNISPCQYDAPVYLSFPHFYDADESLLESVEGLSPNKNKHQTYFKIQPKLGVPIEGKVRVQLNLRVEQAQRVSSVSKFPDIIFPIMWLEEGIDELTPPIKRWIYLATTFTAVAGPLLTYGMIVFGAFVLACVFIKAYKSFVFDRDAVELIELGKRSLRRGSHLLIVNGQQLMMGGRGDSYTLLPTTTTTATSSTGERLANANANHHHQHHHNHHHHHNRHHRDVDDEANPMLDDATATPDDK